ncbi:MAG: hypothetical protein Q4D53_03935 [Leptotrichiaceae bacterium]|nr:hypothetical protein [Leptotrichiaceae bacterium]
MEADNFLSLCGNIIDRKGVNNKKIFNIISKGFELYNRYYEKALFSDVIDRLIENELDLFGSQFGIYRADRTDEEYRKYLKLSFLLRLGRSDLNFIVNAISVFFNIEKQKIKIFDNNSDKDIKVRHIKLRILQKVDMQEIISFLIKIKAAGIIVDCWEMLDGNFLVDCKGTRKKYIIKSDVNYEYDRHEYNLDEMSELND